MFIDRNTAKHHAPFGGAELELTGTGLVAFRSSERRRMGEDDRSYKHLNPNGVKPILVRQIPTNTVSEYVYPAENISPRQ